MPTMAGEQELEARHSADAITAAQQGLHQQEAAVTTSWRLAAALDTLMSFGKKLPSLQGLLILSLPPHTCL